MQPFALERFKSLVADITDIDKLTPYCEGPFYRYLSDDLVPILRQHYELLLSSIYSLDSLAKLYESASVAFKSLVLAQYKLVLDDWLLCADTFSNVAHHYFAAPLPCRQDITPLYEKLFLQYLPTITDLFDIVKHYQILSSELQRFSFDHYKRLLQEWLSKEHTLDETLIVLKATYCGAYRWTPRIRPVYERLFFEKLPSMTNFLELAAYHRHLPADARSKPSPAYHRLLEEWLATNPTFNEAHGILFYLDEISELLDSYTKTVFLEWLSQATDFDAILSYACEHKFSFIEEACKKRYAELLLATTEVRAFEAIYNHYMTTDYSAAMAQHYKTLLEKIFDVEELFRPPYLS